MQTQWHLTQNDYSDGSDYRIKQGIKKWVRIKIKGDQSLKRCEAVIRETPSSPGTLANFNWLAPQYPGLKDDGLPEMIDNQQVTYFWGFLTPNQTKNIPIPPIERKEGGRARIGENCWCWDIILVNPNDPDDVELIVSKSFVEVQDTVTPQ